MARLGKHVRTEPFDFLDRPIHEGDYIVYPTGGTSARMVLAKVKRVEHIIPKDKYSPATFSDGHRGESNVRLVVSRLQEGTRKSTDKNVWWAVDDTREVRVEQLHRVILVPNPNDSTSS